MPRILREKVGALVRGEGRVADWLVVEVAGDGWEVALGVGDRSWRFGSAGQGGFRFAEVRAGREVRFRHAPPGRSGPAAAWPLVACLLVTSLRDDRFEGFDCPVI